MTDVIFTMHNIHTVGDLLKALARLDPKQLETMYLKVNKDDHIQGMAVIENTLTDGSKVQDLHFLI